MNLTIQQLSKATKLSESTIRVYASQRNLGKKIGNKRVFTQADVQKLLKASGKPPQKKTPKTPPKRTTKAAIKADPNSKAKPKAPGSAPKPGAAEPVKSSFWSRIFGGARHQKKVSLMEAKISK